MLEGNGPKPLKLLGRDLVLWKDGEGVWRCQDGICPHRLAPLALGRVGSDGHLMCRFHGWCFRGKDGACVKVPMADGDEEAKGQLLQNARTTLGNYPTKVKKGLLFVWPHSNSTAEADAKEPFMAEELGESPDWNVFDAPASWRVWMEQTWDPSHAPFLHEFTLPSFKPEHAKAMAEFKVEDRGDDGLFVEHGGYMSSNMDLKATRIFGAPCANFSTYAYPDGREVGFHFYFVPSEVGKVRQITTSFFRPAPMGAKDPSKGGLKGNQLTVSTVVPRGRILTPVRPARPPLRPRRLLEAALRLVEKRWPHVARVRAGFKQLKIIRGRLGDQDNAVLSFQDSVGLPAARAGKKMRGMAPSQRFGGPSSEYVLETHADANVARFSAWLAQRGGGPFDGDAIADAMAKAEASPAPRLSNARLMNRWEAHTKFAPNARAALDFASGAASRLEAQVVPGLLASGAACLAFGQVRLAAVPTLAAAGALYASGRLRRVAQEFLSGLPAEPSAPEVRLWDH